MYYRMKGRYDGSVLIYELTQDLNLCRCVSYNSSLYSKGKWAIIKDLFDPDYSEEYELDVLTRDEYFLELI